MVCDVVDGATASLRFCIVEDALEYGVTGLIEQPKRQAGTDAGKLLETRDGQDSLDGLKARLMVA